MSNSIFQQLDFNDFAKDCKFLDLDLFDEKKVGTIKVYENDGQPVLFLKEINAFDKVALDQIAEAHRICWNFQKVLFLYVYTKTEIRIYNCSERPFVYDKQNTKQDTFEANLKELEVYSCKNTDKEKIETLNTIFSRIAIDTGFVWSSVEAVELRKKINLEKRVDKYLIQSLINVSRELEKQGLSDKDVVHKLIMRSLFLLYLEDRGATTNEFYKTFQKDSDSYFKVLDNLEATYSLFERLSNDFNGSLFNVTNNEKNIVRIEHLDLIKRCFINGFKDNSQTILFEDWRLFDFSIIRIELLSEIYENFLSELDKKSKKNTGTFYTPPSLVELILNEKLPIKNGEIDFNIKTLDPSCGSGIFLVQSFKRLVKRFENKHNKKLNDFNVLVEILKTNIFGIELDSRSIKVAAFSLYLALLDNLDPKTGWWNGTIKFPYLINDPDDSTINKQGNNLFKRDTISDLSYELVLKNFDLIVGNPPFGTKQLLPTIIKYCHKENFAKEMVLPFMHKATILAPKGEIALIFNTKVLTNTGSTYQNFRKWLFSKNYVEKIYNFSILRKAPKLSGGQLFGSAVGPISIVFYQKEKPNNPKDTITYYAPKTYIKNDILEGIVIDASDVKYLPRTECEKKDTKIWKISMWGGYFDYEIIKKVNLNFISLKTFFKSHSEVWDYSTGIMADSLKLEFIPNKVINTQSISRYFTPDTAVISNDRLFRKIDPKFIKAPYLIVKEGQKNKKYCSSVIEVNEYFLNSAFGFSNIGDFRNSKVLCAYINSIFTYYFLSIYSSSWGIERERIKLNELVLLPAIIDELKEEHIRCIVSVFDQIVSIKKSDQLDHDISHLEKEIDMIIFDEILKLTKDEQIIIQDTLDYSLDLFEKQQKSQAVLPVKENGKYINRLTGELNDWLDDVDLKASATIYDINRNCPLYLVKISFGNEKKLVHKSNEDIYKELKRLDRSLWEEETNSLYFRKKLNYYDGNDVYIIKPNQKRFWSETAAMEDSKSLLTEILNMKG